MQMKRIAMVMVAGSVVALLAGCGVPKEEHAAKIAELNAAWAEIETLKGSVADTESLLKAEKGKIRNTRIELDDATRSITELTEKEAATATALADEKGKVSKLESDMAAAKSATGMAEDRASEVETARVVLQGEYDKLKADFEQFKKNMRALGAPVPAAPAPAPAPEADDGSTKSHSETALDLLNDMSME